MDNKNLFVGMLLVLIVILLSFPIIANVFASINLVFGLNSSSHFDGTNGTHGIFYLNWTNKSIVNSYKIYVTTNGSTSGVSAVVLDNSSHSIAAAATTLRAGVLYKNVTEANYTFKVQAIDGGNKSNSSIAWMYYDATAPVIYLHSYPFDPNSSSRAFKNTDIFPLNIRISETTNASSVYGKCIITVNATSGGVANQTAALVSNNWCNTTSLVLTGQPDGNKIIKVWVNDTVNNLGLNNTYYIEIDTTAPTISASCSDVTEGNAFPCSCSRTDGGSGVNTTKNTASTDSPDGTGTPHATGSFTYTCGGTDYAGNNNSASATYRVLGASNNGGGSSSAGFWTKGTLAISENQFQEGYTKKIVAKQRVRVEISGEDHHVGVKEISGNTVKIEVSSDPQEANLAVGDSRRFDVTGDGIYDVLVTLNGIVDSSADLTIKSISEEITKETEEEEKEKEKAAGGGVEEEGRNWNMWIIIIIVLIIAAIGAGIAKKKR